MENNRDEHLTEENQTKEILDSSPVADVEEVSLSDVALDEIAIEFQIPEQNFEASLESGDLYDEIAAIPDKMAFKIGEAADIVGVKQYVLRYWETEFDQLKPKKSRNNQRMYGQRDVETALMIKTLLYKERFSIEGARKALKKLRSEVKERKDWDGMGKIYDTACSEIQSLISDIQSMKETFK